MNQTGKKMNTTSKEVLRFKLNRLKEAIDAESLLQHLGFSISRVTLKEVRAPCKVHGGDNKTAFRMNKQTKNWLCFSHGCHEEVGYDVISLVMKMMNLTFAGAITYLENITGINVENEYEYVRFKREQERKSFVSHSVDNRQVSQALVNEKHLKAYKKFRSNYFEKQGFPKEILDKFEIGGGYVDKYGFQRDVIPIRNKEGALIAYSYRDITGKADEDYKYLLTEGFNKDLVLYNLYNAKNNMGDYKTIIVVEGFKSVWKLYMAGYKNVVACIGSRITNGQRNLLYSMAFTVILLFDGDKAGVEGTSAAVNDMNGKITIIPLFLEYNGKDPADYEIDELKNIIK